MKFSSTLLIGCLLYTHMVFADPESASLEEMAEFDSELSAETIQQVIDGTFEGDLPVEEFREARKQNLITAYKESKSSAESPSDAENSSQECYIIRPKDQPQQDMIQASYSQERVILSTTSHTEITHNINPMGSHTPVPLTAPAQIITNTSAPLSSPLPSAIIQKLLRERLGQTPLVKPTLLMPDELITLQEM